MANMLRAIIEVNEPIDASQRHIIAVVTDDVSKAQRDVRVSSLEELKNVLRSTVVNVENAKALTSLAPGDVIDLIQTIIPQTEDETAIADFAQLHRRVTALKASNDAGLASTELLAAAIDARKTFYDGIKSDTLREQLDIVTRGLI